MRHPLPFLLALAVAGAAPASAQLVPRIGGAVGDIVQPVHRALDPVRGQVDQVTSSAAHLSELRTDRLATLVRRHSDVIEVDVAGQPARRGELLLVGATDAELEVARSAGFTPLTTESFEELGLSVARLGVPAGSSLIAAEKLLRRIMPNATITADQLHFTSGVSGRAAAAARPAAAAAAIHTPVGVIDGAPGSSVGVDRVRGFATGAPRPSNHGSAVASLLGHAGVRRIAVADVYGTGPAGGSALAIARGIDWLLGERVRVVSISLVGPKNPLLERAIAAGQRKGVTFVAAVGNDGPAAPPSYPASYAGVLAVTGVDGRNRALIEAGRALHLDYAAPGADLAAADKSGKWVKVRGTSFAAPLAAARAAAALSSTQQSPVPTLDREAVDLGPRGPDRTYGRGLLCGFCRKAR